MNHITDYADYSIMKGVARNTVDTYTGHIKRLYRFLHDEGIEITSADGKCLITAEMLVDFYTAMYHRKLKAETRNNYVAAQKDFFAHIRKLDLIEKDPSEILGYVKSDYNVRLDGHPPYTDDELARLLACFQQDSMTGSRDRAFITLALATAMRVSELCSLTMADVQKIMDGAVCVKIKGGRREDIAVASFAIGPILAYTALRPGDCGSNALFLTQQGTPFTRRQAYLQIAAAQEAVGIRTGIHSFRHTTLTRVSKFGEALARDVACHLGSTVTDRYIHTTVEERRRAIESAYPFLCQASSIA